MKLESEIQKVASLKNLELLAHQIVEGFLSGMHKSPFHGFSAQFAEHKIYNPGENTKHIDWKRFAKTDRLYTKKYEEETNMRCHIIIDNSSSMHYPILKKNQNFYQNKIGFSVLATAVLMSLLKKQRDAVGLSIYSNSYEYYAPEKGNNTHHGMLLNKLEQLIQTPQNTKTSTHTTTYLHQIAEKIHKRSMIVLFTDMFQQQDEQQLLNALQHLKHNKHKVVVFHVYDKTTELNFQFDNHPRKFVDLETGEQISIYPENIKQSYLQQIKNYHKRIENICTTYKIQYVPVAINDNFEKIITTYISQKQKFK